MSSPQPERRLNRDVARGTRARAQRNVAALIAVDLQCVLENRMNYLPVWRF